MQVLKGISAATGLARGIACLYSERSEEEVPHYMISNTQVGNEVARLDAAFKKSKKEIEKLFVSYEKYFGGNISKLLSAHQMILEDALLYNEIVSLIKNRFVNAEHAVSDAFEGYIKGMEQKGQHFAEISHDIIDVRNRILSAFSGAAGRFECPIGEREPVVVVAKRLSPSMILSIPREHVLAFVTEEGGFTTHATILARGYGVPVVFGVAISGNIDCSDKVIVDGSLGKVIIDADKETDDYYSRKTAEAGNKKALCYIKKNESPRTKRGQRVLLKVNISTPGEMELVKALNHDGVGLLRTEFLFLEKEKPPTEEEHFQIYKNIIEEADGKPVVVRLLDISTDKKPPYLYLPPQDNPDLGIRGARALDFFYGIYLTQVKAIMRSARFGDVRILYPLVSDIGDLLLFRKVVAGAKELLKKEKQAYKGDIKEGVMIETPSAAILAGPLLDEADFANIGSNDLLQYTLAASRGNPVSEQRYHLLHPSMVYLIEHIILAAGKRGKEVCLCGEVSSFEEYYPLFLSLGLKSFSVAASKFDDIKCHLLHEENMNKASVRKFYALKTKKEIDSFFESKKWKT